MKIFTRLPTIYETEILRNRMIQTNKPSSILHMIDFNNHFKKHTLKIHCSIFHLHYRRRQQPPLRFY